MVYPFSESLEEDSEYSLIEIISFIIIYFFPSELAFDFVDITTNEKGELNDMVSGNTES